MQGYDAVPVPASLKGVMRDYQEQGFRWLGTLYGYSFGGILADDMGLGKTVQAIALMLSVKGNSREHKTNLIVCPSSLCLNWQSEIMRFAPSLKYSRSWELPQCGVVSSRKYRRAGMTLLSHHIPCLPVTLTNMRI